MSVEERGQIANVLRFMEMHGVWGMYNFQLARGTCANGLGHLCSAADYKFPPAFTTCCIFQFKEDQLISLVDHPISDAKRGYTC